MSRNIEAVVFDMDGVLVDSEVLWRRVREEFAADIGQVWSAEDQESTMGCSTAMWSRLMVERMKLDLTPEQIAAEIKGRLLKKYQQHLPEREGAIAAVKLAATRYKVALASGSPNELASFIMKTTGLDKVFLATMYGDDVVNGKPDPEIYLRVLERIGVKPEHAVGVEDSGNGIKSLKAAGMRVIAAPGPEFPLSAEILALADCVIDSMEDFSLSLVADLESKGSVPGGGT